MRRAQTILFVISVFRFFFSVCFISCRPQINTSHLEHYRDGAATFMWTMMMVCDRYLSVHKYLNLSIYHTCSTECGVCYCYRTRTICLPRIMSICVPYKMDHSYCIHARHTYIYARPNVRVWRSISIIVTCKISSHEPVSLNWKYNNEAKKKKKRQLSGFLHDG